MSSYTTTQSTVLWILYDTTCIALIVCTTFPDRHEMTTLSGSTVIEGVAISTTANTAYGMTRHGERLEDEYEVISPPGEFPYEVPSPPSSRQPLPTIPPPVATPTSGNLDEVKQENVYEPVSGD